MNLRLLHLCDSLFPIGAFAYSDGLESATSDGRVTTATQLRAWLDVCLDEVVARLEGPAVWRAWTAFGVGDWETIIAIDHDVAALRPSSTSRRASRTMGFRLLTSWQALHPSQALLQAIELARSASIGPSLPVAFAGACACTAIDQRDAVEGYAYTRLTATVSAAMRLMPIGQTQAHALVARALDRVPALVSTIATSGAPLESFTPCMDICAMSQQYLHSRLFRS